MIGTKIADRCRQINDATATMNKYLSILSNLDKLRSFKIAGIDIPMVNNKRVAQIMIDIISSDDNDESDGSHILRFVL